MRVTIVDDQTLENDEGFTVHLASTDVDVIIESRDATVSISDNDGTYKETLDQCIKSGHNIMCVNTFFNV